MKRINYLIGILLFAATFVITAFTQQQTEPWKPDQLMPPGKLASVINSAAQSKPLIFSVGPAGLIKGAVDMGPAQDNANLKKLKKLLSEENKEREIVIYCGCCPFKDCPNIRPAFSLLNNMKFTNHKLLDLATNLKVDWINHGYPMK